MVANVEYRWSEYKSRDRFNAGKLVGAREFLAVGARKLKKEEVNIGKQVILIWEGGGVQNKMAGGGGFI